jgi:hypothetical protein
LCCPLAAQDLLALCCPLNADCASPLTISASPDPSTAGDPVTISGAMTGVAGPTSVALWQRPSQQSSFALVATGTMTAGHYTIVRAAGQVQTNQQWYVTAAGARSPTIEQPVQAVVTLKAARTSRLTVVLSGHVTPWHGRELVALEVRRHGVWRVLASPRLNLASSYSVAVRPVPGGAANVRTVFGGDPRNVRSSSPVITVAGTL